MKMTTMSLSSITIVAVVAILVVNYKLMTIKNIAVSLVSIENSFSDLFRPKILLAFKM